MDRRPVRRERTAIMIPVATPAAVPIQWTNVAASIVVMLSVAIHALNSSVEAVEGGIVREEDLRGALDGSDEADSDAAQNDNADETADEAAEEAPDAATDDDAAEAPVRQDEIDYQLARALDLIRGVAIFGNLKPAS